MICSFTIGRNRYFVREGPLPKHIRGATMDDEDGNHNIYIQEGMSEEQKLKTVIHEIEHNERGHLYDDTKSIAEIEFEANNPTCCNRRD